MLTRSLGRCPRSLTDAIHADFEIHSGHTEVIDGLTTVLCVLNPLVLVAPSVLKAAHVPHLDLDEDPYSHQAIEIPVTLRKVFSTS